MAHQSESDLHAELDGLRRRLSELEREHQNLLRSLSLSRHSGILRKCLLGAFVVALLVGAGGLLYGQGDALFIDPRGWIGIGTSKPKATLDVAGSLNVSENAAITGTLTTSGNVGIGTAATANQHLVITPKSGNTPFNVTDPATSKNWLTVDPAGNVIMNGGDVGIGTAKPEAKLDVNGMARAKVFVPTSPFAARMYPADPIVYQDILDAKGKGVIVKLGEYPLYDETTWDGRRQLYHSRRIIRFGGNNEADGKGAKVTIPQGYDTVWIRVLGDRWNVVHAYFLDKQKEDLGLWTGGRRSSNSYTPDGASGDGWKGFHQWVPIPAGRAGELALISKPNTNLEFWLSGVAFSKNPWAHAVQSAVGYHWRVNEGEATDWVADEWGGDALSKIRPGTKLELKVPVIPSGRDKLLYLVERNDPANAAVHTGITVSGTNIPRFIATYDNPFARFWNSRMYERYLATPIPAALIPHDVRFLSVRIDMSLHEDGLYFREIGTHDRDVPLTE